MDGQHPGCDRGIHEVGVVIECGHPQARGRRVCPICEKPGPRIAIAMAYNEHPLDHARKQRAHIEQQLREGRRA